MKERFKESKFHLENSYLFHSCLDLNGLINVQDVNNRDLVLALFSWDIRVVESPSPEARERELARISLTIL